MMIDLPSYGPTNRIRLGSFLRFRPLLLNYTGGERLSDFQVKCILTSSDIPFEKLRADKQDLLFIDNNNEPIPYWIEKTNNSEIIVWLKFSEILSGKEVFYLYYGNGKFSGVSDGETVFEFFDDFGGASLNTDKWQTIGTFDVLETVNGELHAKTEQGSALVVSKSIYNRNIIIESVTRLISREVGEAYLVQDIDNWMNNYYFKGDKWYERIKRRKSGSESVLASQNVSLVFNTYYLLKTILKSSDIIFKIYDMDGDLKVTVTASDTTWSNGYVGFRTYGSSGSPAEWYVDWIRVRKYTEIEPFISL